MEILLTRQNRMSFMTANNTTGFSNQSFLSPRALER